MNAADAGTTDPGTGTSAASRAVPSAAESNQAAERAARITWSCIAEPSDGAALLAREVLGPAGALEMAEQATPQEALAALGHPIPADIAEAGRRRRSLGDEERMHQALTRWRARLAAVEVRALTDRAQARGMCVLIPGDPQWPLGLEDLQTAAPHCLWVHGGARLDHLVQDRLAVAMVGSRASTGYGDDCATTMAAAVAGRGACVISGGAYGIDASAHRGALAAEDGGGTVAVLAGGLDALYPRGNSALLEAIRERCALISEAPPGTAPTRWRFLDRNRLIAALSQAVVVVEASWRSGALSTARHGDDLSRPVGAVPGPVSSVASAGCHRLIRERGAVLITEAADILDLARGGQPSQEQAATFAESDELDLLSPADRRVLDAIPPRSAITRERLSVVAAMAPSSVEGALARMEVIGLVELREQSVRRTRRP